jgi:hypothetical protein
MGLHYYGLRASNAGYSVDFLNLIPVVTFVTAVVLRYVAYIVLDNGCSSYVLTTWPCKTGMQT